MNVVAIWRQEPQDGVRGCTVLEVIGGPKPYARIFDGTDRLEWGWVLHAVLHESGRQLWKGGSWE